MSATEPITDEQWEAARVAFMANMSGNEGITKAKYDQIVEVLSGWDDMTPAERREKAAGNQSYWYKKYSVSTIGTNLELLMIETGGEKKADTDGAGDEDVELTAAMKRCSHQDRMFEDIKAVHMESELRRPSVGTCIHVGTCLMCHVCVTAAENHAKDIALYKACCAKFGSSIPKIACLQFVKVCPGCVLQANRPTKVAGFKPILTEGFAKRGQVRHRGIRQAGTQAV